MASTVCRRLLGTVHTSCAHAVPAAVSSSSAGTSGGGGSVLRLLGAAWTNTRQYAAAASQEQQGQRGASPEEEAASKRGSEGGDAGSSNGDEPAATLGAQLREKETEKLAAQVEVLTDSLKRTLADMENLRARTMREVDNTKKFAIQGLVKSLLEVPDNLERAAGVVPADALSEGSTVPPEKLRVLLQALLHGVQATEAVILKVLKQHGVERYDPLGQPFDPNLHNALFDVPDTTKEHNTVAMVTKRGYKLNDRVIRPAEVGVVKNLPA